MSKRKVSRPSKRVLGDREIRKAIKKAIVEGKTEMFFDARPCSIEIGKSTSGIYSWKVKIYAEDTKAILDSVIGVKRIEDQVKRLFTPN